MRGKRTDSRLVDEIRQLRRAHRQAQIVRMMEGRLHRRTVYRWLSRLQREDEERSRQIAKEIRLACERQEERRRERVRSRGVRRFTSVAQLPANLRKVRS